MPAIEVRQLQKRYGDFDAVKGIDFSVADGELLAILGPNGAGKTTTVEILEGFRERTAGEVSVLGVDPAEGGRRYRERIGIVFQECGIDRYLSAREILQQQAGYYPHPLDVDQVLDLVGLADKGGERVKQFSGGLKRRLDVALGLIGDPDLFFLDEPTTGFDPSARRQSWDLVRGLGKLGKTVLLTTHYMDEAQALADRIIVIAAGQVVAEGTPDTIGGRDTAAVHIRFAAPEGVTADDLPVPGSLERGVVRVETTEPTRDLHQLTGWALDRDAELADLSVDRPSLEDVYLQLTADA